MVTAARMPKPPAALVAAVRFAPDTQPIPVCTTGSRQPTSSQNRVRSAGCTGSDTPSDYMAGAYHPPMAGGDFDDTYGSSVNARMASHAGEGPTEPVDDLHARARVRRATGAGGAVGRGAPPLGALGRGDRDLGHRR